MPSESYSHEYHPDPHIRLADLLGEIGPCQERLKSAEKEVQAARKAETLAINNLNDIQKKVDAAMKSIRHSSSEQTEWGRAIRSQHLSNAP